MSRPIAVLLEIENVNHEADRCFAGLEEHFTLSVRADDVRDDKEKSLLLIGTPVSPNPEFPALRQGPAEVQKVSAHFAEAQREVLLDQQATPAAYVRATPGRFAYVHFVAHGTASHTQPLDSAVILSGTADSYKLYAREIVAHPLRARLVG